MVKSVEVVLDTRVKATKVIVYCNVPALATVFMGITLVLSGRHDEGIILTELDHMSAKRK